jgi:hypothetical protein
VGDAWDTFTHFGTFLYIYIYLFLISLLFSISKLFKKSVISVIQRPKYLKIRVFYVTHFPFENVPERDALSVPF